MSSLFWKPLLVQGLAEDDSQWDWTSLGTTNAAQSGTAEIVAKSSGVWAAEGLISTSIQIAAERGISFQIEALIQEGERFTPGKTLVRLKGNARFLLALERPFLNLASYASGIATQTRAFVEIVQASGIKNPPRISATRKTLPGYRDLAIHAVRVGGGYAHRTSLSGGVLIKENHLELAGSISGAISGIRAQAPHGLKIEIEVKSMGEVKEALDAGADYLLLDNFTPELVKEAIRLIQAHSQKVGIEVSGGVREANLKSYLMPGVDVISVGFLTHSVQSADFSLLVRS